MTPAIVSVPLRRRLSFFRTSLRPRWKLHLSTASVVVGIVGLAGTQFDVSIGWITAFAGLAIGLVLIFPELDHARRGEIEVRELPHRDLKKVSLEGLEQVVIGDDVCAVDSEVDRLLPATKATVRWSPARFRLPRDIAPYAYEILKQTAASPNVFNGRVVRQDDDLTPTLMRSGGSVGMRRTNFFALKCTNYLMDHCVVHRATRQVLLEFSNLVFDKGRLASMSQSGMANSICASTLAFTTDGKVVLIRQALLAESSPGRLAPSGSGSVDGRDIRGVRWFSGRKRLLDIVRTAMERELREEAHVKAGEIAWTEVVGYYRWLNMGAKPEYSGITRLTVSSVELSRRQVRRSEVRFVRGVEFGELDVNRLTRDPRAADSLRLTSEGVLSIPLVMCLRALGVSLGRGGDLSERLSDVVPPSSAP